MRYSLDTSAIIDGWDRHYPIDVFPSLWMRLEEFIDAGVLHASTEVYIELQRKDDDLHRWMKHHKRMLVESDEGVQRAMIDVLEKYPKLVNPEKNRSTADPFVIAVARVHGAIVVTGENHGSATKPKIPFVCASEGIACTTLLGMMRQLNLSF